MLTRYMLAAAGVWLFASPAAAQPGSGCDTTTVVPLDARRAQNLSMTLDCRPRVITVANNGLPVRGARIAAIALASAPMTASAPVTQARTAPMSVPATQIGVNVAGSVYYGTERTFANLAYAASAWLDPEAGWQSMAAAKLNANGYPRTAGVLPLNVPQPVWANQPVAITCTWSGTASVRIDGDVRGGGSNGKVSFTWPGFDRAKGGRPSLLFYVTGANDSKPMANLDCREPGLPTVGLFDKRLVDDLKPFAVLRFLDWSNTNGNPPSVTWATRSTVEGRAGPDGMPLEHMVDLANAVGSDAWFTIPWNADEDFVRRAATLVRDRLSPGHRAYFELSNEVWNFQFGATGQALNEGVAANLSTDKYTNPLYRLSQKTIWMQKIVTQVFAGQMNRVVRVVAAQSDNPWAGERVMEFPDLANWVDAFATAPYFGHGFFDAPHDKATVADLPALFARLEAQRIDTLAKAEANKRTAAKYGKRYITYEAGQHIISPTGPTAAVAEAMQRDPRMGQAYARYLADWKAKIGDTLVLYSATGTISQYGSWGMREYAGQPIDQTPKRKAVLEAVAAAK